MALSFNGTSQYVDCGNNASLNITEGTWMSWIKIPASSTLERVVHKYTVDASNNVWGYWVQLLNSGAIQGGVGNNTASWGYYKTGSVALDDDSIHHIAASFSNSDGLRIYQDGTEVSGTLGGGSKPSTIGTSGYPLYISAEHGKSFTYGKGQKWDVRVYNRVLSANEIAEIYHKRGADRVWQGLVGRWRLDELPSGTPAPLLLDAMDSTTGWTNNLQGAHSLNTTTYKEGSGALNIYKTATDGVYPLAYKNLSTSLNLTNKDVWIWVYIKDTATLDKLLELRYYLYSTASYYYHYSFTSFDVGWNALGKNTADYDGSFGTPNISAINKIQIGAKTENNSDTLAKGDLIFDFMRVGGNSSDVGLSQALDLSGNGNHGTPYNSPVYQASPHRLRRGVLVS